MDSRQAREILMLYRPGSTDAADPLMAEALDVAKHDPELGAWFEQHCAVCAAFRSKLKEIPVPSGLKRQIIIGREDQPRPIALPRAVRPLLAAAAAIAMILGAIWWSGSRAPDEDSFATFRSRMASRVLRGYDMDVAATNQAQIREYFRVKNAPLDYAVSKAIEDLPALGAAVFPFNNKDTELLCLYDGVSADGRKQELWLFIAEKSAVRTPLPSGKTEFRKVDNLSTLGWTAGDKIYLLASHGDEQSLRKYLE